MKNIWKEISLGMVKKYKGYGNERLMRIKIEKLGDLFYELGIQ